MPLKFAVVREDAELEAAIVERLGARAVLLVASGGCTALTLAHRFPSLRVTAFDLNPEQLAHVRDKAEAAARGELDRLDVGEARPGGLNQKGEFEALFRILRAAIDELVAPPGELGRYFSDEAYDRKAMVRTWMASRYWPAAYAIAFNDPLLHAMFGRAATQHATPGSYPGYFQRAFERGLLAEGGPRNPFLQHVLRGAYRVEDAPGYLSARRAPRLELIEGSLGAVPALDRFDLYSLSNLFDWSGDALVADWASLLSAAARPGAAVLVRQLNNARDLGAFFEPAFQFDVPLGAELLARDRSLFYERILVGFRR